MKLQQIDFKTTGRFSSIFLDYISGHPSLRPFYNHTPEICSFKHAIADRHFDDSNRPVLVEVLKGQYHNDAVSEQVALNIEKLSESNAFTVTTGHQLNIFTGPLFFIYKIVAAIKLTRSLKKHYPAYHFVPVYWMASEDHDFDEISYFRFFGEKYQWKMDASGPVGRLSTASMQHLLAEIPNVPEFISRAYLESNSLAQAMRRIVNELFGAHGLLVLDADEPKLKGLLRDVMEDDIFSNKPNRMVEITTEELVKAGYKGQIFPREVNFFYMEDELRQRIVREDGSFKVLHTDLAFSEDELRNEIHHSPRKFSPNVVLRPVYQEMILPNLAYIGGPAEMAYWLQLKAVFSHYDVPFPILFPRLFAAIVPKSTQRKMAKNNLVVADIFQDFETLKKQVVRNANLRDIELHEEIERLEAVFLDVGKKAGMSDISLEAHVMSEATKAEKSIRKIEKKIKRAEERKHAEAIRQVSEILDKLLPNGSLQEREDSFLNFYLHNTHFIEQLIEVLDPLAFKFNILTDDA
jgi:bacillithiol biosynthesis cysteine-adding enzyme BshC